MFDLFNEIGIMLNEPLQQIAYGYEHIPLLFAFFLGLIDAVAPCQLTGNISAMTIYGNKSLIEKVPWLHVFLFVLGKIVVFSIIGLVIRLLGKEIHSALTQMFPILRKAIGPLLILVGLFMIGLFSWRKTGKMFKIPTKFKDSYLGSFLMGASFTLAFCPNIVQLHTISAKTTPICSHSSRVTTLLSRSNMLNFWHIIRGSFFMIISYDFGIELGEYASLGKWNDFPIFDR